MSRPLPTATRRRGAPATRGRRRQEAPTATDQRPGAADTAGSALLARITLPWPLPAWLAWAGAWWLFWALQSLGASSPVAFGLSASAAALSGWLSARPWRRLIVALGFPVSCLLGDAAGAIPGWAWLLPLVLLALAYPAHAWRDAPVFPTPAHALDSLPGVVTLAPQARVLDAGCGLGHGLVALRAAYPAAQIGGIEWSWPLRLWTGLRHPWARVRQGDMWRAPWHEYDLVYLFQRPESMPRAVAKARAEMRPGTWLVSLAFEAAELTPHAVHHAHNGQPIWIYRINGPT